jgi:hypothetical protein
VIAAASELRVHSELRVQQWQSGARHGHHEGAAARTTRLEHQFAAMGLEVPMLHGLMQAGVNVKGRKRA